MDWDRPQHELDREAMLVELASAYQRRELEVFELAVRPDMTLTLVGNSRLAGTYRGYEAFGSYLEVLREVLRSAGKRITFEHVGDEMIFRQFVVLSGPRHEVEMALVVRVGYDEDGKIASFRVEPEDQDLFDHVIDTTATVDIAG